MEKNIAFVFAVSYVTAFTLLHCNIVLATFSKAKIIFLIENPKTINLRLSTNEKDVTRKQNSETESKTPLMNIKKKIGKARNLCGIPVSIFLSLFLCLSITI